MKIKNFKKPSVAMLALLGLSLASPSAFAESPYGMDYAGGEPLSADNVQINSELIGELSVIVGTNKQISFSDSELWQQGYLKVASGCHSARYLTLTPDTPITDADDLYFTFSNNSYTMKVELKNAILDNINGVAGDKKAALVVRENNKFIYSSSAIFADAGCSESPIEDITNIYSIGRMFVETNIKLYDKENNIVIVPNLYANLMDIDIGQSFKILNNDNKLSSSNMFARSAEVLQPTSGSGRNMYVENDYIYSDFNLDTSDCDIFVKIDPSVQRDGLSLVFGFSQSAGSVAAYYAKYYTIGYASDNHGSIDGGSTSEKIIAGLNPTGSSSASNEGYELKYWIADKDVKLKDGTTIKAGEHLTPEQVKQVVVSEDLTFTAHHELVPEDSTGPEQPDEPGDETKPGDEAKPDSEAKPGDETKPNDKSESKDKESSNIAVPNTGVGTSEFGLSSLGLIGSIVSGVLLALGGIITYRAKIKKQIRKLD